jgi:nickel-dependent lactate racemase
MHFHLAYGKEGLDINLPDYYDITLLESRSIEDLPNPHEAIRSSLRAPIGSNALNSYIKPDTRVGIVFSDITRPTPNHILIPAIIDELENGEAKAITLFNSLGTHRPNTKEELRTMLGGRIVDQYQVIQNDAFDPDKLTFLGTTQRGHKIFINKDLLACDFIILTGFIEPHVFAGFSGGGKAIMPGMAGIETILDNHSAEMLDHPNARWGVTSGNPIWEEIHEIADILEKNLRKFLFLVNVALNQKKQISGIFTGNVREAHAAGCKFVLDTAMLAVERPFDIAITTNSGYPLDLNLYQSLKGLSAASQVVRPGGSIIIAAECWDGIPEHGLYGTLLRRATKPEDLLHWIREPGFRKQDQWQLHIQGSIQAKADIFIYSHNLTDDQIRGALLNPCRNIQTTLEELLKIFGSDARICIIPEGPMVIPYLKRSN